MKRYIPLVVLLFNFCLLLTSCGVLTEQTGTDEIDLTSKIDYSEWFGNDKLGEYNCAQWVELIIWFNESIDDYDWDGCSFDVSYENQTIASNLPVAVDKNYVSCYYHRLLDGAVLTDSGYLAPGIYEITLKDSDGQSIYSSSCIITYETGDALSKMIVDMEQLENLDNQLAVRIYFDGDITPYSKSGFFIAVSLDGGITSFIPEDYSIEPADTYLTVRYFEPESSELGIIIYIYCGDGAFVCDKTLEE